MQKEVIKLIKIMNIVALIFIIVGCFITKHYKFFIVGVIIGTIIAIIKLLWIHRTIEKAVTINPGRAGFYVVGTYFIRSLLTLLVLALAAIKSVPMFIGVALGLFTMRVATIFTQKISYKK